MANSASRYSPPPPDHGPFNAPNDAPTPFSVPGSADGFYPLTIGRTVSLALSLYRFGWKTFVAITLIAAVPIVVLVSLLSAATYSTMSEWERSLLTGETLTAAEVSAIVASFPWQSALATFLGSLLGSVIAVIGGGALTNAIATAFAGNRLSVRSSYGAAIHKLRDLLLLFVVLAVVTSVLALVGLFVPLLLLIGPGLMGGGGPAAFLALVMFVAVVFAAIFLVIRLSFAVQVLMLEDRGAIDALKRSYTIVGGSMLRVVGYALVFGLILGVIGMVTGFASLLLAFMISPPALGSLGSQLPVFSPTAVFAQSMADNLLAELFAPIMSIGFVLLYYDIRFRRGERVPLPGSGVVGVDQPESVA